MLLYLNTARHLRPQQLRHYVVRRSARALGLRGPRPVQYQVSSDYIRLARIELAARQPAHPDAILAAADSVVAGVFRFLNRTREFRIPNWAVRHETPLWSFHLQYCGFVEDLAWAYYWTGRSDYRDRLEALVASWLNARAPLNSDAWAPYAVSQRLLHWSRAFLLVHESLRPEFVTAWLDSIAMQTDFLRRNIEWDLLGNHVHQNLCGLIAGAGLFADEHFAAMRTAAARLLWWQLDEQVLADGMHVERSPMYHAQVLANTLEAITTSTALGVQVPQRAYDQTDQMRHALGYFVRNNGSYHLFNDAANDERSPASVTASSGVWSLPSSGYYGCSTPDLRFIIDCGEPGPDYQAGHGHCDLLSYELDLHGAPFVVDSGTSGYDQDPLRGYMRSTRAHNTVVVGDGEQQELWGTFRMARRATVGSAMIAGTSDAHFVGSYSPYYSARVTHTRTAEVHDGVVAIEDRVTGADGRAVRSFVHFHPSVEVRLNGTRALATGPAASAFIETRNVRAARIVRGARGPDQGWYAPEFGMAVPAPVLELTAERVDQPFGYTIELLK